MAAITNGLDELISKKELQDNIKGNIAYLCHDASVTKDLIPGITALQKVFGDRLIKLFGPQHGMISDVQDNMVESDHFTHPHYKLPVYSLYSETRSPTPEMLEGVDSILIDLQDVGVRVYTYISTLTLLMKACADANIQIFVLDRPNPIGGKIVEGSVLKDEYKSFVGITNIPHRHGLSFGEFAAFVKRSEQIDCKISVIPMEGWKREMSFYQTKLHWINPSPNLPTINSVFCFPATVLFEGTKLSEGRGTTRSLELVGHPKLDPFRFLERFEPILQKSELKGFSLRPTFFRPTFQKFANQTCGGIQIHVTNPRQFMGWRLGQLLIQGLYHELKSDFVWNEDPYEYEYERKAINLINGNQELKDWVENSGSLEELSQIEQEGMKEYMDLRKQILIYK